MYLHGLPIYRNVERTFRSRFCFYFHVYLIYNKVLCVWTSMRFPSFCDVSGFEVGTSSRMVLFTFYYFHFLSKKKENECNWTFWRGIISSTHFFQSVLSAFVELRVRFVCFYISSLGNGIDNRGVQFREKCLPIENVTLVQLHSFHRLSAGEMKCKIQTGWK